MLYQKLGLLTKGLQYTQLVVIIDYQPLMLDADDQKDPVNQKLYH